MRDNILGFLACCAPALALLLPALWLATGEDAARQQRQWDYQACVEQGHHPADCIKRYPL